MTEIEKIFHSWSNNQVDNDEIKKSWGKMYSHLNQDNTNESNNALNDLITIYCKQLEQQAFMQGYKQGVRLFLEILDFN